MQYLLTERAHLMCPHMNFGLVVTVDRPYDGARVRDVFGRLTAAHPFLSALLGYEAERNAYYYDVTGDPKTELLLRDDSPVDGPDAPEIMAEYARLTRRDWDLFKEGMLKAAVWPAGEKTCFLLVFHHLLADGRGALGLAREMADDYAFGIGPVFAGEDLIRKEDLPTDSRMPPISRFLVDRANRTAAREGRRVSYPVYHAFADRFLRDDDVSYAVSRLGGEALEDVRRMCRDRKITVNDWLLARMMKEEDAGRVVMACDLRGRLPRWRQGALGNCSTAFSVEIRGRKRALFDLAADVHAQAQKKMAHSAELYLVLQCYANLDPAVLDAAFIACRGGFDSRAGRFVGGMFFGYGAADGFSVTNLGPIESDSIAAAYFIPPASPAIRKTRGVLTVNGVMTVCDCERPG